MAGSRTRAVAYCRISTLIHGQDIRNQAVPIEEFAEARGFELVKVYQDEGISGATERRRGLDQMLADAKRGHFKVLIVMEISRLARDVRHLLNLLHDLDQIGVGVISIREGIEFSSTLGRAMVAMIGIFMSVERELLSERIRTSLAVKKAAAQKSGSGWRSGRPTKVTDSIADQVVSLRQKGHSIREIAKQLGIAKSSVQRVLTQKQGLGDSCG